MPTDTTLSNAIPIVSTELERQKAFHCFWYVLQISPCCKNAGVRVILQASGLEMLHFSSWSEIRPSSSTVYLVLTARSAGTEHRHDSACGHDSLKP